jgi:hypothetical protein
VLSGTIKIFDPGETAKMIAFESVGAALSYSQQVSVSVCIQHMGNRNSSRAS